jgi:hypothetical protein
MNAIVAGFSGTAREAHTCQANSRRCATDWNDLFSTLNQCNVVIVIGAKSQPPSGVETE